MLLYGQEAGGAAQGGGFSMLIMMAIIFAIFFFLIIRPQRKKQKDHQTLVQSLKGGERVITSGGIFGTVDRVLEDRVDLKVDKNTRMQVLKTSISTVVDQSGQQPQKKQ
ncbi:MAG: preprotein translocase subunit YajC [Candidatus Aminicenantes bacterium]|nr:preprotein translocase subunit YajC [Candidatus Aminicenantes bacterium]